MPNVMVALPNIGGASNYWISAASGPKFTILWRHMEEMLLLNTFFRLSICALVAKI